MLVISDKANEKLKELLVKAVDDGSLLKLMNMLHYLDWYGEPKTSNGEPIGEWEVHLYPSFDLSNGFGVVFKKIRPLDFRIEHPDEDQYAYVMNGGLVYHESSKEWSVHT